MSYCSWKKVSLSDITTKIGDGLHGTPNYDENGEYYFINGSNLLNGQIVITDEKKRVSKDEFLKYQKELNDRTILVSINGTLGNIAIYSGENIVLGKSACYLNIKTNINRDYIKYVLSSNLFQEYIHREATGSTIKNVSLKMMRNFEFNLPEIEIQNYVVAILGCLDQKIHLNTQINQTLEQIAQTIFKSWFIDFDPVHAKANALANGQTTEQATLSAMATISGKTSDELHRLQTANPEQYQQLWEIAEAFPSGFGEDGVPWGWEMTTFGGVSQCFDKKRIPLSKRQREQRAGSIPYYGATSVMDYVDEAIFDDIYLLIGEDGSVLKEDSSPFIQYIWGKAWVNNHAHVLQGKGSVSTEQLMLFMASTNITAYVTGAVQMKLNQANMNSIPFVKATDRVNELFFDLIKDLYAKIRSNTDENRFLVKIRDELLPKLLSGEI